MRTIRTIARGSRWAMIVALATLVGCAQTPTRTGTDETADSSSGVESGSGNEAVSILHIELGKVLRGMEDAMRANDLAAVAAFYADDAILMSPSGKRTEGRAAIDEYWTGFGRGIDWKLDVLDADGDPEQGIAYQRGRSTLTYARGENEPRTSVVEFVLLWQRDDTGAWRVALDAYW